MTSESSAAADGGVRHAQPRSRATGGLQSAALEALPMPVSVLDSEGIVVFVNGSWRESDHGRRLLRLGYGPGSHYRTVCEEALAHLGPAAVQIRDGIAAVLAGAEPFSLEHAWRSTSGLRWLRLMASPLAGTDGGAVVTHADISAQKAAQRDMGEIEAHGRAIVDSAPDAIVTIDQDERIVEFNPAAQRIFGWTRAQALGRDMAELLIPPGLREQHRHGMQRYRQAGDSPMFGKRMLLSALRADGSEFPIELTTVRMGSHQQPRFTAFVRDVSAQRRAEERLRHSEALLRIAGRAARIGGWSYDFAGNRARWSDEMCEILELPRGTGPDARSVRRWFERSDFELLRAATRRCRDDGAAFDIELRMCTGKGRLFWSRMIGYPERDTQGRVIGMQGAMQDIDERRGAQQALHESELRFKLAARATSDAMWDWDIVNDSVWWSEGFERLFGRRPDPRNPALEAWVACIAAQDRDRVLRSLHGVLDGGRDEWRCEYRFQRMDGSFAPVRDCGHVLRDADGRAVRMVGGLSDLTQSKQGELELARSLRALQLHSACSDALMQADSEEQLLQAVCRIAVDLGGYRGAVAEYLSEGGAVLRSAAQAGHAVPESDCSSQLEVSLRDGSRIFARLRLCADASTEAAPNELPLLQELADDLGFGIAGIRLRQEQQCLQARVSEQASLLDKAHDAIVVCGIDQRIRYWNRSADRLYGWSADEACGTPLGELLCDDVAALEQALVQLVATGKWSGQLAQKRRDGSAVHVESHWTLVRDERDQPHSILCINTDIAQRLAMEDQLRQSQRLEAVGQLTGGVAHDFNNLLTVILGNTELLMEALAERGERRLGVLAEMTRDAAQRGAGLTHRLLAFARRQSLQPEAVDANRLLLGMRGLLDCSLRGDIEVSMQCSAQLWPARVDPAQLEAALLNLCLNARDAMPDGGRIVIETCNQRAPDSAELPAGDYVAISVRDNGHGIAPEHLARVFEPFFTTKEVGKGTGLGLSMVYGFVRQSQGQVTVGSEPGRGTCVRMLLPRAQESIGAAPPPAPAAPPGGSEKILLVEDDGLVRRYAEDQLLDLGYRVLSAGNGAEALQLLREIPDIDLLFTDIVMPGGVDGFELAQQARRLRPQLGVLYTSGYHESQAADAAGELLLSKPYHRDQLARRVRAALAAPSNPLESPGNSHVA